MTQKSRSSLEWTLLTLIMLVAALLRFHNLGDIPKGLEHDEVATWHMVVNVLNGKCPIYFEEGYGHEPLFNYFTAISMSLFGYNWLGERFWAPWFGMVAVAATYALLRRMFNSWVGICGAAFQATVLWAFFFNRLGLRLNMLPFMLTMGAYCFWRGIEVTQERYAAHHRPPKPTSQPRTRFARGGFADSRLLWFSAAGLGIGLCFYTYMSSRIVPLLFATFTGYLIARDRWFVHADCSSRPGWKSLWQKWWPVLICFLIALLVMLPLALYLLNRPSTTATPLRESQVNRPLQELLRGHFKPVLENAWALIKMWNVDGERYWQLNYSHRPVFVEPISGILFWIGAGIAIWQWREPRMVLLLMWIAFGMVPSLLTSEAPSWPRTMLASPAALALPGIALSSAIQCLRRCRIRLFLDLGLCRLAEKVLLALIVFSVLLTIALTYRDFLQIWPQHPRVRYAFQSSLTEALRYLDATADASPVVMAGLSPHDMDPWTERSTLRRQDLSIRWVDTRSALVIPSGNKARLIVLDITPMEPVLAEWADLSQATVRARGQIVPRGGTEHEAHATVYYDPAYTVYHLDTANLWSSVRDAQTATYAGENPFAPAPLDAAPQFGGLVRMLGYRWLTNPVPGKTAQLLTFWQTLAAGPSSTIYGAPSLRTFVHLIDQNQAVVTGTDILGSAPDTWQAGDMLVQLHTFASPAEPGTYAVELGWYRPPDGPRLPVDDQHAPGERILLVPIEMMHP